MGGQHEDPLGQPEHLSPHDLHKASTPQGEELDSISHLKIWGNTQNPHQDMAYLLVWVDNTPNAKIYSMTLVWVSLLQTKASSVVEALEILTTFAFEGSDWPYTLIQLYEGANHMPLPENKHLGVLCQEQTEVQAGG